MFSKSYHIRIHSDYRDWSNPLDENAHIRNYGVNLRNGFLKEVIHVPYVMTMRHIPRNGATTIAMLTILALILTDTRIASLREIPNELMYIINNAVDKNAEDKLLKFILRWQRKFKRINSSASGRMFLSIGCADLYFQYVEKDLNNMFRALYALMDKIEYTWLWCDYE